jgi:hypothetical protein
MLLDEPTIKLVEDDPAALRAIQSDPALRQYFFRSQAEILVRREQRSQLTRASIVSVVLLLAVITAALPLLADATQNPMLVPLAPALRQLQVFAIGALGSVVETVYGTSDALLPAAQRDVTSRTRSRRRDPPERAITRLIVAAVTGAIGAFLLSSVLDLNRAQPLLWMLYFLAGLASPRLLGNFVRQILAREPGSSRTSDEP